MITLGGVDLAVLVDQENIRGLVRCWFICCIDSPPPITSWNIPTEENRVESVLSNHVPFIVWCPVIYPLHDIINIMLSIAVI